MNTRSLLASALLLMLVACGSPPQRKAPSRPVAVPTQPPASGTVPAPPPNLAAIPDAVPRAEPRTRRGNPPTYEVLGKRYTLMTTDAGYKERGVASWYGPNFHAKATSNGDAYDMYAMTAAHKTLPIPAYVRVTNLSNGRSVVVRVNDRGPFVDNRIIDLSYTAAWKLDMLRSGTAFVEVEALLPGQTNITAAAVPAPPPPPLSTARGWYVQAGAFAVEDNAARLVARLKAAGFADVTLRNPGRDGTLWRVRIGPVADVTGYDQLITRLSTLGVEGRLATE